MATNNFRRRNPFENTLRLTVKNEEEKKNIDLGYVVTEVLQKSLKIQLREVHTIQDFVKQGLYDITLNSEVQCQRVLEEYGAKREKSECLRKFLLVPLYQEPELMITVHCYDPYVNTSVITEHLGGLMKKVRYAGPILNQWKIRTGKFRYFGHLEKDSEGNPNHLSSTFNVQGYRGYLFYRGQPVFCRQCRSFGHKKDECTSPKCTACNEYGHTAEICVGIVKCGSCHELGHDAAGCPSKGKFNPVYHMSYANVAGQGTFRPAEEEGGSMEEDIARLEREEEQEMAEMADVRDKPEASGGVASPPASGFIPDTPVIKPSVIVLKPPAQHVSKDGPCPVSSPAEMAGKTAKSRENKGAEPNPGREKGAEPNARDAAGPSSIIEEIGVSQSAQQLLEEEEEGGASSEEEVQIPAYVIRANRFAALGDLTEFSASPTPALAQVRHLSDSDSDDSDPKRFKVSGLTIVEEENAEEDSLSTASSPLPRRRVPQSQTPLSAAVGCDERSRSRSPHKKH